MGPEISRPSRLSAGDDLADFDSGEPVLDEWLRRGALQNEATGASRTYVVCAQPRVIAYYTLAVGAVAHAEAPGRVRRNMPDPIPAMLLGRLAVDRQFQNRGIGDALLRDAILRTLQVAEIAGIRAVLVHAISDAAKGYYERRGFVSSPLDPMTVMITVAEAAKILAAH